MVALWPATKMSNELTLKMLVKINIYKKSLSLGYYATDFNQIFTKMVLLGRAAKASRQLTFKSRSYLTNNIGYYQIDSNQSF